MPKKMFLSLQAHELFFFYFIQAILESVFLMLKLLAKDLKNLVSLLKRNLMMVNTFCAVFLFPVPLKIT